MDTIWSYVIWGKLGMKDFQIHLEPPEKSDELVLEYMKGMTQTELNTMLEELSGVKLEDNPNYYDGPIYNLTQDTKPPNTLIVHDVGVLPLIMQLLTRADLTIENIEFIKQTMSIYESKIPPNQNIVN